MCSPEEAQGNENLALLNASPNGDHLDPEISRCSVEPEKKSVCSPVEAQGNEKTLVNASPNVGHLDPEIPQCSVVPGKKNKGEVHEENDGKSTARMHIQHMVQRRSRNRVVEGNKW